VRNTVAGRVGKPAGALRGTMQRALRCEAPRLEVHQPRNRHRHRSTGSSASPPPASHGRRLAKHIQLFVELIVCWLFVAEVVGVAFTVARSGGGPGVRGALACRLSRIRNASRASRGIRGRGRRAVALSSFLPENLFHAATSIIDYALASRTRAQSCRPDSLLCQLTHLHGNNGCGHPGNQPPNF
jgi:hypothetical protein